MSNKKTNSFKLSDFQGVDMNIVAVLEARGIKTAPQLLAAGAKKAQRLALARAAGLSEVSLLELVKLSDLARLPGVKGIRARLYYDAGFDSLEKIAVSDPETILKTTADFVTATGFPGIAPLPKEVTSTIANAQRLPLMVEF